MNEPARTIKQATTVNPYERLAIAVVSEAFRDAPHQWEAWQFLISMAPDFKRARALWFTAAKVDYEPAEILEHFKTKGISEPPRPKVKPPIRTLVDALNAYTANNG